MKKKIAILAAVVGIVLSAVPAMAHGGRCTYNENCTVNWPCGRVCSECGETVSYGICTACGANQRLYNDGMYRGHHMGRGHGCDR